MNKTNHRVITAGGLKSSGLQTGAMRLIVGANDESDYLYSGLGMFDNPPQHFQGPTEDSDFEDSMSFYRGALHHACHYVVSKGDHDMTRAFYFLGRALHCIQDFYAHTNWVALEKTVPWHEKKFSELRLSSCTPKGRVLENLKSHKSRLFKDRASDELKQERRGWFDKMQSKKLIHPDIQLDFHDSFASKICEEFLISRRFGYDLAEEQAIKHTTKAWGDFLRMVKLFSQSAEHFRSLESEMMSFNPTRVAINWIKHRSSFSTAVKGGFPPPEGGLELKYI